MSNSSSKVPPIVDVSALVSPSSSQDAQSQSEAARELYSAFSTWGFCQITGHGVQASQQAALVRCAEQFFLLPDGEKMKLAMDGSAQPQAYRGYMPRAGDSAGSDGLTDRKEGLYVGLEHPAAHPLVQAGMPFHGRNLFPADEQAPGMRDAVMAYVASMVQLGRTLTDAVGLALGLERGELVERWLEPEPVAQFRCFMYPPLDAEQTRSLSAHVLGKREHTDFGSLTILKQEAPGLQALSPSGEWIDVPVVEDAFIVNVGDMLDMLTHGRFRSPPHRVIPPTAGSPARLSFPFFLDFAWNAKMVPLDLSHLAPLSASEAAAAEERWKHSSVRALKPKGEWWQYLTQKMQKVFPGPEPPAPLNIGPRNKAHTLRGN